MCSENSTRFVPESFKYITLGKLRFIGVDAWHTGENWDSLWIRSNDFLPLLDGMMSEYGTDIPYDCSLMHHNGKEVDSENHYLAGRFFKEGTPVPRGFDYYDLPTKQAAYAIYRIDEFDGDVGHVYYYTRDQILSDGISIPYPNSYWHASVYIDGRPDNGNCRLGYLFSIVK